MITVQENIIHKNQISAVIKLLSKRLVKNNRSEINKYKINIDRMKKDTRTSHLNTEIVESVSARNQ